MERFSCRAILIALVLGGGLFPGGVAEAGAAGGVGVGSIAFIRSGNVWLMEPDGANQRQLTNSGGCAHPSWSPQGDCLVFEQNANLVRLRLSDGQVQRLTTSGDAHQPAWRPGTAEVWYVRIGARVGDVCHAWVWVLDTASGKARRVATVQSEMVAGPGRCSWRSDGAILSVDLEEGGEGGGCYFYAPTGKQVAVNTQTTNPRWGPWAEQNVAWHPTRPDTIAEGKLYRDDPARLPSEFAWSLVTIDLKTRLETPLYDAEHPADDPTGEGTMMAWWPTWCPDGEQIAFCLSTWGKQRPCVMAIDVSSRQARRLADDATEPAWSPTTASVQTPPSKPATQSTSTARSSTSDVLTFIKGGKLWVYDTSSKTQQVLPMPGEMRDSHSLYEWSPTGEHLLWNGNTVIDRSGKIGVAIRDAAGQLMAVEAGWMPDGKGLIVVNEGKAVIASLDGRELFETKDEHIEYAGVYRDVLVAIHRQPLEQPGDGEFRPWLSARRLTGGPVRTCPCPEFRFAKESPASPPRFSPDGTKFGILQGFMHGSWYNWYTLDGSLAIKPLGKPGSGHEPWTFGPDGAAYYVETSCYATDMMLNDPQGFAPTVTKRRNGQALAALVAGKLPLPSHVPNVEVSLSGSWVAIEVDHAIRGRDDLVPEVWLWRPDDGLLLKVADGASTPHWWPQGGGS